MRKNEVRKYSNPFPPLELSPGDEAQLASLAHMFVHNTIAQYLKYQHKDERVVDHNRWKFVKRKQNIRVYAERREKEIAKRKKKRRHHDDEDDGNESTGSTNSSSLISSNAASTASHRFAPKAPMSLDLPVLFVVGTLEGTLDDALYGAVNPTVEMLRTKTSYVHDNVVGAAVLATLIAPTPEDPFRTMTIKWFEKGQPLHIRTLVSNRDMVFLESTGTTQLPGGERLGYQLLHSVHFPQTSPLATAIRGNMSICAIYRQFNSNSVDVFVKGYMNPAGGLMRAVVIKSAAEGMVSAWKYVHCARMKKLAWVLRQRHARPIDQIRDDENPDKSGDSGNSNGDRASGNTRPQCVNCKKTKKKAMTPGSLLGLSDPNSQSSNRRMASSTCKLCFQYVCSTCRMRKKLSYIMPDGRLQQNELTLCALCVHDAMIRTDARRVASDETAARRNKQHHGTNSALEPSVTSTIPTSSSNPGVPPEERHRSFARAARAAAVDESHTRPW